MDAAIQSKVESWLMGNYDQETKAEIIRLQKDNPSELTESFYRNLNSARVVCGELWVSGPTV